MSRGCDEHSCDHGSGGEALITPSETNYNCGATNSLDLSQASLGQYPLESKTISTASMQRTKRDAHLGVDIVDLLNSASLTRPAVLCSNDTSIGPLPQLLLKHILRIYDKSRVECLERVPLHDGVFQVETKEQEEKERRKR